VSKKSSLKPSPKNASKAIEKSETKAKSSKAPGELQPHNAKKEALGPNTNR